MNTSLINIEDIKEELKHSNDDEFLVKKESENSMSSSSSDNLQVNECLLKIETFMKIGNISEA